MSRVLFLLGVAAGVVYWLLIVTTSTGPFCPGKDPTWLGFCHEAPDRV